ncbi:helix-turn-helix domain-containing protein [Clostridium manihotivorum]|uniref:Stage 0 sporulation protein A homolog n=1 Tax=Clostridium manihotivorum TaxID=2320868 RepID=A0A410DYT4_9CLOT|nr:helix-turn-helix domain-containing protein [Clostridium manihotivorum]QAA34243.1 DNA-binding response regulator [Clostridium manihotivorum]
MVKLLIADDEKYDREAIISILNGEFGNKLEVFEARNGREAIEISEQYRPDIVITDIKMPGINGIIAIEEIKRSLPNTYFIILTAYDYFDFAVEAVKNNVKEYILKPFGRLELVDKIRKAITYVDKEKAKRKSEIENAEKLNNLISAMENELSYYILSNTFEAIDEQMYKDYLNLTFENTCSMVIEIDDNTGLCNNQTKKKIGEYIKGYINLKYRAIGTYRFTKELVYFIEAPMDRSDEDKKITVVKLAVDIRKEVKRLFELPINVGIGRCYTGLSDIYISYKEACASLDKRGDSNITHIDNIKENQNDSGHNVDSNKLSLFKDIEKYIIDNMVEELDLDTVAAKFNLSCYHFSRTFKEVVGCNFSDYINIVRIKKAKEMLRDNSKSIKEVCFSVGYNDPNYFSKVFKKYEGQSPTEFRR